MYVRIVQRRKRLNDNLKHKFACDIVGLLIETSAQLFIILYIIFIIIFCFRTINVCTY